MKLIICSREVTAPEGITLPEAVQTFSPYGEEAVICLWNDRAVRSIDAEKTMCLSEGDHLDFVPLIIGG